MNTKVKTENIWQDVIVALLSVNQYTLNSTYKHIESLEEIGLFDPANFSVWDAETIEAKLKEGGCNRGAFMTNLFAERIASLGQFVTNNNREEIEAILHETDKKAIEKLLLPIKGIGNKVISNFFALRELDKE